MAALLLRAGADPAAVNDYGDSPRTYAQHQGATGILKMLDEAEGLI